MVTAMLAVWLAGAAYLPLDPGYPAERLGYMLADAARRVLVVTGGAAAGRAGRAGHGGADLADPGSPRRRGRWPAGAAAGPRPAAGSWRT